MINKIHPTLSESNKNMHRSILHRDLDAIEKLISYAKRQDENKTHIPFLEQYKEVIERHEEDIRTAFDALKKDPDVLTRFLNESIESIFEKNNLDFNGTTYYFSYFRETYTFFKYLFKDDYTDKNTYGLFTYKYKNNRFYLDEISIDFENTSFDLLSKTPKETMRNLEKMDDARSIKEVQNIHSQGEKDIKNFFATNDIRELFEYEDDNFNSIFGYRPVEFIRNNNIKKKHNIVRLQLEKHLSTTISVDLIKLLTTENFIIELMKDPLLDDDTQKELLNRNNTKKNNLMVQLNIQQTKLDELMSYVDFTLCD